MNKQAAKVCPAECSCPLPRSRTTCHRSPLEGAAVGRVLDEVDDWKSMLNYSSSYECVSSTIPPRTGLRPTSAKWQSVQAASSRRKSRTCGLHLESEPAVRGDLAAFQRPRGSSAATCQVYWVNPRSTESAGGMTARRYLDLDARVGQEKVGWMAKVIAGKLEGGVGDHLSYECYCGCVQKTAQRYCQVGGRGNGA